MYSNNKQKGAPDDSGRILEIASKQEPVNTKNVKPPVKPKETERGDAS